MRMRIILILTYGIAFLIYSLPIFGQSNQNSEEYSINSYLSEINYLKNNDFGCEVIKQKSLLIAEGAIKYDYIINEIPLIHHLCYCGNAELLRVLYNKNKIDLEITNKNGSTPLMFALFRGNVEIIIFLLKKKALVGKENNFNESDIQFLIEGQSDDIKLFKMICDDKRLNQLDNDKFDTLLLSVIRNHKTNFFNYLWSLHQKWNRSISKSLLKIAIASGNLNAVNKIILTYSTNQISLDEPFWDNVISSANYYNLFTRISKKILQEEINSDDSIDIKLVDLISNRYKLNLDDQLFNEEDIIFSFVDNYPMINFLLSKKKNVNNLNKDAKTFLQSYIDRVLHPDSVIVNNKKYPVFNLDRDYKEEFMIINHLINKGAFVNESYKNGLIYLILESLKENKSIIVEKLLTFDLSLLNKDNSGKSVIDYTLEHCNNSTKEVLKSLLLKISKK